MFKVGEINDTHLGLKTEKIDRTDEIFGIYRRFAKRCIKEKVDAIVIGGDIFDKNDPSEELIAVFIQIMNMLNQVGVPVYIVVGNHDAVADPKRLSCLSFVKKLKKKYPNFHLIEDITCIKIATTDIGPLYFTFLPHVSMALLKKKGFEGTTQEYIDKKAMQIYKKVGAGSQHLIFSHLNVRGVIPGSEENLLKKSEVYLPEIFVNPPPLRGYITPQIAQAHIHLKQQVDNIHIIGSPLFCEFGEDATDRYFAVINQPNTFSEEFKIDYISTGCKKFYELVFNISGNAKEEFHEIEEVQDFLHQIEPKSIIKINPTIHGNNAGYDWTHVRNKISELTDSYVKEIVPRIIRTKIVRNVEQKPRLSPKKAVYVWLKTNKPPRAKTKMELAKNLIEKTL